MGPQEVTSTTKTQQNHKPSFKELLNPKSTFSERGASKTAPKKQGDQENQSQRYKQTTVSPFPPSSPEPAMTERNRGRVISPDAIRFQNSYFTRPEPVFPPMIPVSARDYATARPTPHTRQPNNNPLIPVNVPSLKTPRYNLIRRNQVSPALSYDDDYYDSLRRKYTVRTISHFLKVSFCQHVFPTLMISILPSLKINPPSWHKMVVRSSPEVFP